MQTKDHTCPAQLPVVSTGGYALHTASKETLGRGHEAIQAVSSGWKQRLLRWGLAGSLVSIAGLIGLSLFEQYKGMLGELRTDLKRFNETSAEYVKRDQMQRCWEQVRQVSKELHAANAGRAPLEQELRTSERGREELAKEIQRLRERLAYLEGQQAVRAYSP